MTRPPLVERPIYLAGADLPPDAAEKIAAACRKGGAVAGVFGGAVLGATVAYFIPKLFDWALPRLGDQLLPDDDGGDEE